MNKEAGCACPACVSNTKQPEIVAGQARAATMNVAGAGWASSVERGLRQDAERLKARGLVGGLGGKLVKNRRRRAVV